MSDAAEPATISATGGCQCGAVRYAVAAPLFNINVCHCRMCQKASGGPFMAFGSVPSAALTWTRGRPKIFKSSNLAERGFCEACGTPLTYRAAESRIGLTLGSLDDPAAVTPGREFGIESRLPWLDVLGKLPAETTDAWMARDNLGAIANYQHPDRDT